MKHPQDQLSKLDAEKRFQDIKDKTLHWLDDARAGADGKYGPTPRGESLDFWRGRRDALADLAAFFPTAGTDYVHVSRLKAVSDALKDAISTYGPKDHIVVTTERQEAWAYALSNFGI